MGRGCGGLAAALLALTGAVVMAAALPATADPDPPVGTFEWSANMEPLGWSPRPNPTSGVFNSDLAFWGQTAYQGTYDGFQIIDISNPHTLKEVAYFMPDVPPGAERVSSNDVTMDDRGLIYLLDRVRGLHILERTGN